MKYVITNDWHLTRWAGKSSTSLIINFLKELYGYADMCKLALNGDIANLWENPKTSNITDYHREIFELIGCFPNKVYIPGNHDGDIDALQNMLAHVGIDMPIVKQIVVNNTLITHGDIFDPFVNDFLGHLTERASFWYERMAERLDLDAKEYSEDEKINIYDFFILDRMFQYNLGYDKHYDRIIVGHLHRYIWNRADIYSNGCCLDGRMDVMVYDTETDTLNYINYAKELKLTI